MKRTILAPIIGITAAVVAHSAHAQGTILLDNYDSSGAQIFFNGAPLLDGTPAGADWTIGIYGAIGSVTVAADPTGMADPTTLGPLTLLSGSSGDTAQLITTPIPQPGYFSQTSDAVLPGYVSGTATFMVVAYSGSTYDTSIIRGHSAAFNLTPATGAATAPLVSGGYGYGETPSGMQSFDIFIIPEPSMFALSGIGAMALFLVRRKK